MKFSDITNLIICRLARQFALVLTGNIFSAGLGFLAILLVTRHLTVGDFGLFNIARSFIVVGASFSGLGLEVGMIKFSSSYLKDGRSAEASDVFRTVFLVIAATGSLSAIIVFGIAEPLSVRIFRNPELIHLIKLASIGILSFSVLECLRAVFCSYQSFAKSVVLQLSVDVFKLSGVIFLLSYFLLDSSTAVAVFAFAPLFGVALGLGQLGGRIFTKERRAQHLSQRLFSYGKWLFASNICNTIYKYVGLLMLARMLNSKAAGIYGLAINLAYIFPILMDSMKSVLLPEVSRFTEVEQFERYVRGSLRVSLCIGLAVVPILFLSRGIIAFFFGLKYIESVSIFNVLLLSQTVLIANGTFRMALYSMNKPRIIALTDSARLAAMFLGCYFLIPYLGMVAPAVTALVLNVCIFAFLYFYLSGCIKRKDFAFREELVIEPYSG